MRLSGRKIEKIYYIDKVVKDALPRKWNKNFV